MGKSIIDPGSIHKELEIFRWIESVTEDDGIIEIFMDEDQHISEMYCGMKNEPFQIYTEINSIKNCVSVSIRFPLNYSDSNRFDIIDIIEAINKDLLYGFFRIDYNEKYVIFYHSYPYSGTVDTVDVDIFKKMFPLYLMTVQLKHNRITRSENKL